MKSYIWFRLNAIVAVVCVFGVTSFAGTSVGNFYHTQQAFNFRIGYPATWTWTSAQPSLPFEVEHWVLDNSKTVGNAQAISSITVSFLDGFPATNDAELLREIKSLHPGLTWTAIQNPDFAVGYVSNQTYLGAQRTESFEYYFSSKNRVDRLDIIRDATGEGAAQVDGILATIRRPSGVPHLVSIQPADPVAAATVNVGDRVCYQIKVDQLRTDFDADSLAGFEVKGAPPYLSFKDITWDSANSLFKVCLLTTARFGPDGLTITSLRLSSTGLVSLNCFNSTVTNLRLMCSDPNMGTISYKMPTVNNSNPILTPPKILGFRIGSTANSVRISLQEATSLSVGEVEFDRSETSASPQSQIIYSDQFTGSTFEIAIDPSRLSPGFNKIGALKLMDRLGNITLLKAQGSDPYYTLMQQGITPQPTSIPIVNVMGGTK